MNDLGVEDLFEGRLEGNKITFELHPAIRDMRIDERLVKIKLEIENLENFLNITTGDEKRRKIEEKKLEYLRLFLLRAEAGDLPPSPQTYQLY